MNIDFTKGIHTETKPINTPAGYYRDALNMRATGHGKKAEAGMLKTLVPENIKIWGDCPISNETIILGQAEDSNGVKLGSVIGSLDTDGNWTYIVNRGVALPDLFDINAPTQVEGRNDWKGDRLIYFGTPNGARRINLDEYDETMGEEELNKVTSLFLEYDLPITVYTGEDENGEVLSGVYQLAARLVTDSGAGTVFGLMSNIVSVVQDSLQTSRDNITGVPPQSATTKSINFTINNVDPTFKYIEVGVLTYVGVANSTKVTLMNRVLINGRTSISISYRGPADDAETLTLDELITSGIQYQTGEYFAQKDGTLLVGNPTEAELPPIDWWQVAQGVVAEYIIDEVPWSNPMKFEVDTDVDEWEAYNVKEVSDPPLARDFRNPLESYDKKGYRREEVYAFTLTPVFVSGVVGPTVQIPAMDDHNTDATPGGPITTIPDFIDLTGLAPGSYGKWSVVAVAATLSDQSDVLGVDLLGGPGPPTNGVFDGATSTNYTISWYAAIPETGRTIVEYWVFVTLDNARQIVGKVIGTPPLLTFTGAVAIPGVGYTADYIVEAVDSEGFHSAPSNDIEVTVPGPQIPPEPDPPPSTVIPPTNLVASNIGTTRFRLSWDASVSPGVTQYLIYLGQFVYASVGASGVNVGGKLGTFISDETYNDDRYPDIPVGSGIRLHKFPDAQMEPLIGGSEDTGNLKRRDLGVRFSNIRLSVDELQYADQIAGIIIGRVDRRGNETQLAQGLVRPTCDVYYDGKSDEIKSILLGDGSVNWDNSMGLGNTYSWRAGIAHYNSFHFLSPDIIHKTHTSQQGSHIQQHSLYVSDPYPISNEYSGRVMNEDTVRDGDPRVNVFFRNIVGASTDDLVKDKSSLDGSRREVGPFGVPLENGGDGGKINTTITLNGEEIKMCSSDGFVWMQTVNGDPIPNQPHDNVAGIDFLSRRSWPGGGAEEWNFVNGVGSRSNFVLYSMVRNQPKQYGPLDQMIGMFTHYEAWQDWDGSAEFYNGDTFISKYGLSINDEAYYPFVPDDEATDPDSIAGYTRPSNTGAVVYMWVESYNNYGYRHYLESEAFNENSLTNAGSVPFFPAYKQLVNNKSPFGILSMHAPNWTRPGYASQYNKQYSAQPNIKPYPVIPKEDTEELASLLNRILYSSQVVQGEKNDSYQIFLPNDYYDVPQEFGALTDVYVNRELYASTNQVQWKLFFNTLATQVTSAGEVVLGTGGAFNRPAVPMQTVDGGYGGTSHWLHATNTIYGRVFTDKLQGRIFLLAEGLSDVSMVLSDSFRLRIQSIADANIITGSEALYERAFFRLGDTMLSFSLIRKQFISSHDYLPRWMFSHASYMYSNNLSSSNGLTTGTFKNSVGLTGMFFGKRNKASITLAVNIEPSTSKLFRVLELITNMENEDGLNLPFSTFNQIEVWNDERNSGLIDIITKENTFQQPGIMEILESKVKDTHRISIPRDIVIDPSKSIWDTSNHAQLRGDTIPTKWLPKIRGNFVEIKLIIDNTLGPITILKAKVELSKNIR